MSADPTSPRRPPSTDALIERCLAGDQAAWEQIVRQHWRKVFNLAYKFVGRHDEAEDLTQDIFLKIFKALHTFDRRANFQTWLISISRNLCIDHYRSVRKERETMARDVDASELTPVSRERGPARPARADSICKQLIRLALAELPPALRQAVVLRDLQEFSYQEIADQLGLPEGTVKSRINRGRLELARQLVVFRSGAGAPAGPARRNRMNVTTSHVGGVVVHARQRAAADLSDPRGLRHAATDLIGSGESKILVDLAPVGYVDSATIGCLMDLYRQATAAGGAFKLAGVQKRVETMLTMTGAHNFLEVHADQASALASFGG